MTFLCFGQNFLCGENSHSVCVRCWYSPPLVIHFFVFYGYTFLWCTMLIRSGMCVVLSYFIHIYFGNIQKKLSVYIEKPGRYGKKIADVATELWCGRCVRYKRRSGGPESG